MPHPIKIPFYQQLLTCLVWFVSINAVWTQDFIVLRTGDKLNVQILGITKEAITFRHPNVPADSISALPIVALKQVQYANGLEQYFFLPSEDKTKISQTPSPKSSIQIAIDTVVLRNGKIETGKVIARKRFSIEIAKQLGKNAETLRLVKIHSIRYAGGAKETIMPPYSFGNPFLKSADFDCLSPHFLGVSTGISLPVGNYAAAENQNVNAGFATAGLSVTLSGFFRVYNGWGLSFNAQRNQNPYNNGGLRQQLSDKLEAIGFLASGPVQQSDWLHHSLAAGPSYFLQQGRCMVNVNFAMGLLFSDAPTNQIAGTLAGTPVILSFVRNSTPSPVVLASLDARYFLLRNLQAFASIQYLGADLNLGETKESVESNTPQAPAPTGIFTTVNAKKPMNQLSFHAGVLFTLPFLP